MNFTKEFKKGLWDEIPPFRLVLGLCPTLGVTTTVENGIGMGLSVTFVLACSNVIISLLRKWIPSEIRIAAYIVVIATFTVMVEMVTDAWFPALAASLGLFIPLIVVNCIVLGRAEAFASKHGVMDSMGDGLGIGLGFTMSLTVLGTIREVLGAGTFLGTSVLWPSFQPMAFMLQPPGAFMCLGLMLGAMNIVERQRKRAAG
jgi:electron transport complex protein RnfE